MKDKGLRAAIIYFNGEVAGTLSETNRGYRFVYDKRFLNMGKPISLSLPLRKEPFESKDLFPFFQGLLPEGWYLDLVQATRKIDAGDPFGLLLSTASIDTIGAVTVEPEKF